MLLKRKKWNTQRKPTPVPGPQQEEASDKHPQPRFSPQSMLNSTSGHYTNRVFSNLNYSWICRLPNFFFLYIFTPYISNYIYFVASSIFRAVFVNIYVSVEVLNHLFTLANKSWMQQWTLSVSACQTTVPIILSDYRMLYSLLKVYIVNSEFDFHKKFCWKIYSSLHPT